ncbi:short chain dehydrogenase/reductase family protein [Cordyceps fumosorosea ARSEF 2679]|uniref:Short chain dehydrogenase/reductase family protein n=1 Tax=Cordyceps fumosorosea (strain ARSEF 2679) TaxID=1081104 RepID=A0A167BI51_CORFA|nr:short chain dehydrogenase/reductase family protein [Cordyceps fumosorosea ARSEF 2679]OAA40072.1 short chain dehydrogenase/reductase family protein [Cordyceps fumosorosea ARSEF 2679]
MQSALHKVVGPDEVQPQNLSGRVAVVIGGALGIGYEVSAALARAGCKVIMVNRSQDQGDAAIAEIQKQSKGEADIDWKECDLGNLAEVRAVFGRLRKSLERLDYLVLSAGINANQYALDHDGIERIFAVNYLGQVYAVNQLWAALRKTSLMPGVTAPRVVAVSSVMHQHAPSNVRFASLDEINDKNLSPAELYARSKLAQILFVRFGLVKRVIKPTSDSIYALAVHPGTVNTAMQEQWKDAYPGVTGQLIAAAMKTVGRDPEQGSYSTLWALTAPDVEQKNQNGAYFTDPGQRGSESAQASDERLGAALWELSEKLIKEKLGDDALESWRNTDFV